MKTEMAYTLGFLLASVTASHVHKYTYSALNFAGVISNYVMQLNESFGGMIADYGYTEDYEYWKHIPRTNEHPVKGEVDWIEYTLEIEHTETLEKYCTGIFSWFFDQGIVTPFSLIVETTVPVSLTGPPPKLVKFNLSGTTNMTVVKKWGDRNVMSRARQHMRVCPFRVKVNFDGFFAFCFKQTYKGSPRCTALRVTNLTKSFEGLTIDSLDKDILTYMLNGTFMEQITCYV